MRGPCRLELSLTHDTTWMDEGFIVHLQGSEGFACEVSNPILELALMIFDQAALLTIQGKTDRKFGVAATTMGREVWWLYSIA